MESQSGPWTLPFCVKTLLPVAVITIFYHGDRHDDHHRIRPERDHHDYYHHHYSRRRRRHIRTARHQGANLAAPHHFLKTDVTVTTGALSLDGGLADTPPRAARPSRPARSGLGVGASTMTHSDSSPKHQQLATRLPLPAPPPQPSPDGPDTKCISCKYGDGANVTVAMTEADMTPAWLNNVLDTEVKSFDTKLCGQGKSSGP